ncbi:antibiotic biosynthesis monooxygenase [Tumidithrix elongata RA019]|uniref:Antibiotic biosynthesis monooxygenase n=1 Tax=Tumidithrix elongata BACA0141 TaxID=2716417 RepID=A0AAW9Q2J1_9CYAN|nr:antibiotic biosynthesis monooxygenase [Tumidithrix elongata RA019]
MQNSEQHPDPITLVISEIVEPDRIQEYEAWTKGINQSAQQFEGFLGVEIICPRDHDYPEYVVIVKFDNYIHYKSWLNSPTYQKWMERSQDFISRRSLQQLPTGLELWFSLPRDRGYNPPQPAYYKQVILGVVTVYPLILLANALIGPFLQGLPPLLGLLISVIFVSALLTYPVMPWLTKLLSFWLYPSSRRKRS